MTDLAMPQLQRALVDAARRQQAASRPASEPGDTNPVTQPFRRPASDASGRPARRSSRWKVVPVIVVLVLAAAAVAVASGLVSFGAPATSVPVFANPSQGLGTVVPGSATVVPVSVPDPHGGLPWGIRVLKTTRGVGCLQVGRLLDGRLVAVGQDGAFGDDGKAHELALSTNIERLNCSFVDGRGRIFESVTIKGQPASAAPGVHCEPPGTYAPSHHASFSTCPLQDERNLYYGMLGPDATSLSYRTGGRSHTVATVGPDGAYLIVTTGTSHRYSGQAGTRERRGLYASDDVPVYGPIATIHYRDGSTCHLLTAERWIYGPTSCDPPVAEPFGWSRIGVPTAAQLATPIHAALIDIEGRPEIRVSFTSRVTISSLRAQYELEWRNPGKGLHGQTFQTITEGPGRNGGMIPQGQNVAAGHSLTATIDQNPFAPRLAPGVLEGGVVLSYAAGPLIGAEEDTTRIPVGTFSVTVP